MDQEEYLRRLSQQHALVCVAPTQSNKFVDKLQAALKINVEPELVPIRPEEDCKVISCYYNVEDKVKRDGGYIHYGWAVWQSHYLCQSEHHAVWEDEEGNLIDITPREKPTDFVMFLPNNDRPYKGKPIARVQINTTNNAIVDDIIYGAKVLDWFGLYETRIDRDRASLPKMVMDVIGKEDNPGPLRIVISQPEVFYLLGNKPNSKCYCGSNKQYNNCHGLHFRPEVQHYVKQIVAKLGQPHEYTG